MAAIAYKDHPGVTRHWCGNVSQPACWVGMNPKLSFHVPLHSLLEMAQPQTHLCFLNWDFVALELALIHARVRQMCLLSCSKQLQHCYRWRRVQANC